MTSLFVIGKFDLGPHFCAAVVRADTAEAAKAALAAHLDATRDETVWAPDTSVEAQDRVWTVRPVPDDEAVVFVLGSGCRDA